MLNTKIRVVLVLMCILCMAVVGGSIGSAQEQSKDKDSDTIIPSRGSIPEELLRPKRGESLRYAVDTVIGPLGQGEAGKDAYQFAKQIAAALLEAKIEAPSLKTMNKASVESYLTALDAVSPRIFRIGGGKAEDDGAISFLIRFIGREQAITGELFIRLETKVNEDGTSKSTWIFEELILENPQNRTEMIEKGGRKYDFPPYERFF